MYRDREPGNAPKQLNASRCRSSAGECSTRHRAMPGATNLERPELAQLDGLFHGRPATHGLPVVADVPGAHEPERPAPAPSAIT